MRSTLQAMMGIAAGVAVVVLIQACCGEQSFLPLELGRYGMEGQRYTELEDATLTVDEDRVTMEYTRTNGQTGTLTWSVVKKLRG